MPTEHTVQIESATITVNIFDASGDLQNTVLILAHGAGAGQRHPFMVAFANGLAARGIDVVTFDFPYMAQKRKVPDRAPVLEAAFEKVIALVRGMAALQRQRLFIGGKSMGGRMATHLAARQVAGVAGTIALGYPLHPPGKPDQLRREHLPAIDTPLLIVQGDRDTFGTPKELEPIIETMKASVTLHRVAGGDHSFKVSGRKPAEVYAEVMDAIVAFILRTSIGDARA